jgi:amino acid permease
MFSFLGVEILVITAGEAKNARKDLPRATSWTYVVTIFLYFISTLIVSFNVGYDDPALATYDRINGVTSAYNSPFIISMRRSALSNEFVTVFKWCFFVSAATTA